jgi:hypothetical protein
MEEERDSEVKLFSLKTWGLFVGHAYQGKDIVVF